MNKRQVGAWVLALGLGALIGWMAGKPSDPAGAQVSSESAESTSNSAASSPQGKPTLTVELTGVSTQQRERLLSAQGPVQAWQETVISAAVGGIRLQSLHAQNGDWVKKGQVLAILAPETVEQELASAAAALEEAKATWRQASSYAERARPIAQTGAMSAQQLIQIESAEAAAKARVSALTAQWENAKWRLSQTRVLAPDDGWITARPTLAGTTVAPGAELFRLIRQGRLEWKAEVTGAELLSLKSGMTVRLQGGSAQVMGQIRQVSASLDATSRAAWLWADLPASAHAAGLRSGMFVTGDVVLGQAQVATVPQTAVVSRDGFHYVYRWKPEKPETRPGADPQAFLLGRVEQRKVRIGRVYPEPQGAVIEVMEGLDPQDQVVRQGGAFLADGDRVRVLKP